MPLQPWMELVSVDDHLIEHPNVWSDRLPKKCLEVGVELNARELYNFRKAA